jgi:hypothetical protein
MCRLPTVYLTVKPNTKTVETQFMDGWKHSTPKPQVLKVVFALSLITYLADF